MTVSDSRGEHAPTDKRAVRNLQPRVRADVVSDEEVEDLEQLLVEDNAPTSRDGNFPSKEEGASTPPLGRGRREHGDNEHSNASTR
jgi:hypothetical protein